MKVPASFTQVEGWRESFDEARAKQEETRTDSLFPEIPQELCGEPVRAFSLKDWTILESAENPLLYGGKAGVEHASNVIWLLRTGMSSRVRGNGRIGRLLRARLMSRIMRRYDYFELGIIGEVSAFIDAAFMDMPGRYAEPVKFNPTNVPRISSDITICAEIMNAFPSFSFNELHNMPLAQLWQWVNMARKKADPEYRNDQLTDEVNRRALGEMKRLKREAVSATKKHQ